MKRLTRKENKRLTDAADRRYWKTCEWFIKAHKLSAAKADRLGIVVFELVRGDSYALKRLKFNDDVAPLVAYLETGLRSSFVCGRHDA